MSAPARTLPRGLLVCDYFIRYTAGLVEGLRANGWEPVLLNRDHDHAFGGRPGAMRAYVTERLGPDLINPRLKGRVRDLSALGSVVRARRQVKALAPDVKHIQLCTMNDMRLAWATGLRPGRYAITVHDIEIHPGDPDQPWHRNAVAHALVRNAGLVFAHAEPLREGLIEGGWTRAPIVVLPHGIDAADPVPLPEEPSLLFFGRLSTYKGLAVLFDAMERVWERRPDVRLTVAGEGELPAHRVTEDPRVTILHRHIEDAEVPGLFNAASLVALPYVEASQSGVGSLAKGFGRPLVASAVGGLTELLSDGSGALVPLNDPAALAAMIDELLGDRDRLERMAEAGLRTLRERAGWPAIGALTVAAYERHLGAVLGERRLERPAGTRA